MNLNDRPTIDQLAQLFATRKDSLDNHILWIAGNGQVHLESMGTEHEEATFEAHRPDMCARLRTYRRGLGYVGRKAAADREFVGQVLATLQANWPKAKRESGVQVIDRYS